LINTFALWNFRVSEDFSYQTLRQTDENYVRTPLPYKTSSQEIATELRLYFSKRSVNYNRNNTFQPLELLRIIIHKSYELPSFSGYEIMQPEEHTTHVQIQTEMSSIDENVQSMAINVRNCYLNGEKKLKYFKVYTSKNCKEESLSDFIFNSCKCVPFYVISKLVFNLFFLLFN
jgi:hypothetical protein